VYDPDETLKEGWITQRGELAMTEVLKNPIAKATIDALQAGDRPNSRGTRSDMNASPPLSE
jgi:hypothetical protein